MTTTDTATRPRMSKRQRSKITRGVQYAVLVVAAVLLAIFADWGRIASAFFDLEVAAVEMHGDGAVEPLEHGRDRGSRGPGAR